MKIRILGTLCVIGSVLQVMDGIRWATFHITSGDSLSLIIDILFSIGALCALWGLLILEVTGTKRIFQVLTVIPMIGFLANMVNDFQQLAKVALPDDPLSIVGGLLSLLGLLVVGILTIAAKRWMGWRRFTPLIVSLAFPLAILVRSMIHTTGTISIFMGSAMVLFGYAVLSSSADEVKTREVMTQPGTLHNL
jgi:hypothetical protein